MSVTIKWNGGKKKLGSGEYTAENGDFPNDAIEEIHVPFGESCLVYKDYGFSQGEAVLQGGDIGQDSIFRMSEIGLEKDVSSIRVAAGMGL